MWLCGGISTTSLKFSFLPAVQLSVLRFAPHSSLRFPLNRKRDQCPAQQKGQCRPTEVCTIPSVALLRSKGQKWILLTEKSNPLLPLCHGGTTAQKNSKEAMKHSCSWFLIAMFQKAEGLWQLLQRLNATIIVSHAIQSWGEEWWLQMITSVIRATC